MSPAPDPRPTLDLDRRSLSSAVGAVTFTRGVLYVRQGAVRQAIWHHAEDALIGTVAGADGAVYITSAHFLPRDGGPRRFERGECTCPVRYNCKHSAALVLSAAGDGDGAVARPAEPAATWETPLRSLLGNRQEDEAEGLTWPLALELALIRTSTNYRAANASAAPLQLSARLVRRGQRGWVAGGLTWRKLSSLHLQPEYLPEQVRVLQEVHALYSARAGHSYGYSGYGYGYGGYADDRSIDLCTITSRAVFPLLAEAAAVGVRLVHADPGLGDLPPCAVAELSLDVTDDGEDPGALVVVPVLRIPEVDEPAVPVAFIGHGAGAVVVDAAAQRSAANPARWPLRLVTFADPPPGPMRTMAVEQERLTVPAEHRERFRDEYYPRMRRLATVISSDGAFDPPEISAPTLVLNAAYGTGHGLALSWEWAYDIGGSARRVPTTGGDDGGYRDRAAEAAILAELDPELAAYGLLRAAGAPGAPAAPVSTELSGMETMRFTTQALPLLDGRPGLAVEPHGTPADYREAGDSLRIGVSTAESADGEGDWYDLGVSISVEGQSVPFIDVFVALANEATHLLLPGGAYFSLEKPELLALRRLIDEARTLADRPDGPLRISRFQTGMWSELVALGVVESQAATWQRHIDALRELGSVAAAPLPAGLNATLRPYQVEGFEWLAFLWEHRLGGILADDMGLGKTVQALALICHARAAEPEAPPFLIVAPTSVVSNWTAEAARFAPGLRVAAVTETGRKSGRPLESVAAGADIVLTSYALLRIDAEAYVGLGWAGLLLDEAQFVKNRQAKAHQCARRVPAPFKLAMTGTPMENSVMELWSLLSIAAPGLFPHPGAFKEYYANPIERGGDAELLAQLRRRVKPLMKRRTKEAVASELPPKQEQVLEVALDSRHRRIYDLHLQRERQKVLKLLDDVDGNRFTILSSLTLLRQLSLHPGLVEAEHRDLPSAKIEALLAHVEAVAGTGHRTLVFSQFTGLLDLVQARLEAAGVEQCRLDGSTKRRGEVIARFKEGTAPVFLISLKAGGFGLNLTEADYCFLMDPWWNPATEAQAVDRTHRIGQTRSVNVYRLIAADTIEAKVMALKSRKAALFSSVMDDGGAFGQRMGADDIRGLFS